MLSSFTAASFKGTGFTAPDAKQILKEAEEGFTSLKRFLGVEKEEPTLCDLYAAPFIHGPAVNTETRRLQSHIDDFADAADLERAHAQLLQMKEELPAIRASLDILQDAGLAADDAHELVASHVRREKDSDGRRQRLADQARRDAERDREVFEEKIAARMEAADEAASRMIAEATQSRRTLGWQAGM